jgi:hypothetical protein
MSLSAATITMTMREADRLKTVQAVLDRMLRVDQAAQKLGVSRRQFERIRQRYFVEGATGLVIAQARPREQPSTGNHLGWSIVPGPAMVSHFRCGSRQCGCGRRHCRGETSYFFKTA